jgi:hypothetical protein
MMMRKLVSFFAIGCSLAVTSLACASTNLQSGQRDCQRARSTPCRPYSGGDYFAPIDLVQGSIPGTFQPKLCGGGEAGYEYGVDFGDTLFEAGTVEFSVERDVTVVATSEDGTNQRSQGRIRIIVDSDKITDYQTIRLSVSSRQSGFESVANDGDLLDERNGLNVVKSVGTAAIVAMSCVGSVGFGCAVGISVAAGYWTAVDEASNGRSLTGSILAGTCVATLGTTGATAMDAGGKAAAIAVGVVGNAAGSACTGWAPP